MSEQNIPDLVIIGRSLRPALTDEALTVPGWRSVMGDAAGEWPSATSLVIADEMAAATILRVARGRDDAVGSVPIVVTTDGSLPAGADDRLPPRYDADALAAAAARWRPLALPPAWRRMAGAFGADEWHAITARFAQRLRAAIQALDEGTARKLAHDLAGSAGTLGFAALGRSWLALSTGEATCLPALRRETRRHLFAIHRAIGTLSPGPA